MKWTKWLTLLMAFLMLFALSTFIGCFGTDSDDDDDDDGNESVLVGTWYRYSLMVSSTNFFMPSKTVMSANGSGVVYTYEVQDNQEVPSTDNFTWEDEDGTMTIYDDNGDLEWSGPYTATNNGNVVTASFTDEGMNVTEVSVKQGSDHDAALAGEWYVVSFSIDGQPIATPNWVYTLNSGGTYSTTGWDTDAGTWSTNSGYFLGVSNDDPQGRDYGLFRYTLSDNDSTVTMTGYDGEVDEDTGMPDAYTIEIVLSKDSGGGGGQVDDDLVGTWHSYYFDYNDGTNSIRVNSLAKTVMSSDGTGTRFYMDEESETVETDTFTWGVADGNLTVYDTDGELVFYGPYSINNNTMTVTYSEEDNGDTYTVTSMSVKETGDIDTDVVGSYVPIEYMYDDMLNIDMEYITLNEDGTMSSNYLDDDEEVVEVSTGTWTTSGLYMIGYTDDYAGLAFVMEYQLSDGGLLDLDYYFMDTHIHGSYVMETGAMDSELVGIWDLTARMIPTCPSPQPP